MNSRFAGGVRRHDDGMDRHSARARIALALLLLVTTAASADAFSPLTVLSSASSPADIGDLGRGIGIVFTPDLSVPGNCGFYEALGFACYQTADWRGALQEIGAHNTAFPNRAIRVLIVESHGTNGNGLKLQDSKLPGAPRSYISVGALQERLARAGVGDVVLSACNSGRLLRPSIYRKLDRNPGDKLFLPPTLGVIDASDRFDENETPVRVFAPAQSHIETTVIGSISELTPATRGALREIAAARGVELPQKFAISDMLMQILARDPSLRLERAKPVEALSGRVSSPDESERLFAAFVKLLDQLAADAQDAVRVVSQSAASAD